MEITQKSIVVLLKLLYNTFTKTCFGGQDHEQNTFLKSECLNLLKDALQSVQWSLRFRDQ